MADDQDPEPRVRWGYAGPNFLFPVGEQGYPPCPNLMRRTGLRPGDPGYEGDDDDEFADIPDFMK
ncbi:hypothetical protein ACIHFE_12650 [Streptomyces sp. NPDC052396]|uniref:hypothetical protein n=1 Tax=Streptomyces sp. NPDC052396 TaxID=3365689 RepID=UPI0037D80C79